MSSHETNAESLPAAADSRQPCEDDFGIAEEFAVIEMAKAPDIVAQASILFGEQQGLISPYLLQYAIATERERCARIADLAMCHSSISPADIASKIRSGE